MKVKILKSSKKDIKVELDGEGHTFCNVLQRILVENNNAEFAGYDLPHPLIGQPVIYIRMKNNEDPKKVLVEAAKNLSTNMKEFENMFKKELKKKREKSKE
jgi:DNA-directed RNA polymerase subunit L